MIFSALFGEKKTTIPSKEDALPGRSTEMPVPEKHFVNGNPLKGPFPEGMEMAVFGLGCFWGAERKFWQQDGVYTTAVGYAAGITPNPTYREVCSGMTGHNEVVLVVFDPQKVSYEELLKVFWEAALTPITYLVVGKLKKAEGVDLFDTDTDFSPFSKNEAKT